MLEKVWPFIIFDAISDKFSKDFKLYRTFQIYGLKTAVKVI